MHKLLLTTNQNLWNFVIAGEKIKISITIIEEWIKSVEILIKQNWAHNQINQWKGEPMRLKFLDGFKKRLEEVCKA